MTKYIRREEAIEAVYCRIKQIGWEQDASALSIRQAIRDVPAADVRPVVHGEWKHRRFSEQVFGEECSVCHTTWDASTNYCPNCGADMREEN